MKISLLYITTGKEPWAEEAESIYFKKLKAFCDFELKPIKSSADSRARSEKKREKEADKLLEHIDPSTTLILLDEKGKAFADSRVYSQQLVKIIEMGRPIQFVIGGAFGVSERLKQRAQHTWTLSPLTFNHHLARVVFLEQTYRALTIWKGIPYHN